MKIRKRQSKLYEIFNGRNRFRYIAISIAYIYLIVIFVIYNIFHQWSADLTNVIVIFSFITLIRCVLKTIFEHFYKPRFNPSSYYNFAKEKFNFGKSKSDDLKFNKAIIATRKYIDRHYSRFYNTDILLSRLKNVKSNYDIFTQLPSNYIIGIATGAVSGALTSAIMNPENENILFIIFNGIICIIISIFFSSIVLLILYHAIKSFYSEYDSIIVPYEISKIKQQLSKIDDIYLNI